MFSKKEGFKYEVEVKALIREATEPLNQRIFTLEMVNQRLELEVNTLRHGIYNDIQRLEKRITDFTDVWHPIMTQNINRIKADLEKTIVETERKDIANIQSELELKMKQIIEDNEEIIIIGRRNWSSPIIVPKNIDFDYYGGFSKWCNNNRGAFYFEQLKKLQNIKKIDIHYFDSSSFIIKENFEDFEGGGIMNAIINGNWHKKLDKNKLNLIKEFLQFCELKCIKILHNEKEFNNCGVSIKTILENSIKE